MDAVSTDKCFMASRALFGIPFCSVQTGTKKTQLSREVDLEAFLSSTRSPHRRICLRHFAANPSDAVQLQSDSPAQDVPGAYLQEKSQNASSPRLATSRFQDCTPRPIQESVEAFGSAGAAPGNESETIPWWPRRNIEGCLVPDGNVVILAQEGPMKSTNVCSTPPGLHVVCQPKVAAASGDKRRAKAAFSKSSSGGALARMCRIAGQRVGSARVALALPQKLKKYTAANTPFPGSRSQKVGAALQLLNTVRSQARAQAQRPSWPRTTVQGAVRTSC